MTAAPLPVLRLNQGDPTEARAYYCAHFVAAELGFFAEEGVGVEFSWAASGGATILGGQVPAVIDGAADLAIGGPMVIMRMVQDGGPRLMAFCAAVAANPWVLVARDAQPGFALTHLTGRRVCDIATIGTATMVFTWLLRQGGIDDVRLQPGSGDAAFDIAAVARGDVEYGLNSLHALGPAVAEGRVHVVAELAGPTGPVPWSAYIARPDRLTAAPAAFAAFTRAIGRALGWVAGHHAGEITALVARHYPNWPQDGLRMAIEGYKASGTFATGPLIPKPAHDHFARILTEAGWLTSPVAYSDVVETTFAAAAGS